MSLFYNIGHSIAHAIASVIVAIGLSRSPAPVITPPIAPTVTVQPITQDDVAALTKSKASTGPAMVTVRQSITINNNPAPVMQEPLQVTQDTTMKKKATATAPEQVQETQPEAPVSQASITIEGRGVAPMDGAKLARSTPLDEKNSVTLGAFLTDADGNNDHTSTMHVTTADNTQDKILVGTAVNENGVYYYAYQYDFTRTGEHTITFSANGVSKSVTFEVKDEDTR